MQKTILLIFLWLSLVTELVAQSQHTDDSLSSRLTQFSAYVEPYYSYDFNHPEDGNRPGFLYAYNRHNEVNLHVGFLKASYSAVNVRANAALAAGTYISMPITALSPGC